MIIDTTYFKGIISLPNLTYPAIRTVVEETTEAAEKELLQNALGYELYDLLMDSPTDQRFKDIIEGKSFSFLYKGRTATRKWNGLKNKEKISPIAYLAYYHYLSETISATTGLGESVTNSENSTGVSPTTKLVRAFNKAVELIGEPIKNDPELLFRRKGAQYEDWGLIFYNDLPSLYNFMLANAATYPEWEFKGQNYINVFGF